MPQLTLISFPICPFVQRAVIALKEKGVSHNIIYVDLTDKPAWFREISPLGKVPVLRVEQDGKPMAHVFESAVISEYVEETAPGRKMHPEDPLERAFHRSWIEFASQTLIDHAKLVLATGDADRNAARAALRGKLEILEAVVVGPFFSGADFCLVDASFAPLFRSLAVTLSTVAELALDGFPKIALWSESLAARPSVIEAVPADYSQRYREWAKI